MGTRVFRDVDYNEYLRVSKALSVCAPDVEIQLISRDDMLFLLGHSSYIPCTFQVTLTDEQIENIHEKWQEQDILYGEGGSSSACLENYEMWDMLDRWLYL